MLIDVHISVIFSYTSSCLAFISIYITKKEENILHRRKIGSSFIGCANNFSPNCIALDDFSIFTYHSSTSRTTSSPPPSPQKKKMGIDFL